MIVGRLTHYHFGPSFTREHSGVEYAVSCLSSPPPFYFPGLL